MTVYSQLTRKDIDAISTEFDLGKIDSWQPLFGGSENSNYTICSEKGKYVLSICEQKSEEEATKLSLLLEHLQKHHYNSSRVIRTYKNQPISAWKGKPVLLKEHIEGNVYNDLTPDLLKLIGIELGKLHKVPPPDYLPRKLNYGKESFKKVKLYASNSSFDHWIQDILKYITPYLQKDLPCSLIHGDVFWNNVIVSQDHQSVIIMDFEEATYYYRTFDIGMTIIGTCGEVDGVNLLKASHLIKGYRQEIRLNDFEVQAIKAFTVYAGASMTFWRHINFNFSNPISEMSDHYLGLKRLTDDAWEKDESFFSELFI